VDDEAAGLSLDVVARATPRTHSAIIPAGDRQARNHIDIDVDKREAVLCTQLLRGGVPSRPKDEIRDIMREIPPDSAARNPRRRVARARVEIVTGGFMKKKA
jgi:hypothetical protein